MKTRRGYLNKKIKIDLHNKFLIFLFLWQKRYILFLSLDFYFKY